MFELWGIGKVVKTAIARQTGQGGENVTIEVNFEERRKDAVKNQVMKVKAWGSVGQGMKNLTVGTTIVVAGRLEVSEYEWQGKPTKSYAIAANAVQPTVVSSRDTDWAKPAPQQPVSSPVAAKPAADFSEFGEVDDIPF